MQAATSYPIRFSVDYPERDLNRLTTFFRPFVAIPIFIVLSSVAAGIWQSGDQQGTTVGAGAGGLLVFGPLLMILFRRKYPRWWFDWNRELLRFANRVVIYLGLMDDRYPSTDDQQSVHLDIDYPNVARDLNRGLPLVKWFLAIPHYVVLVFLYVAALIAIVIAWFAILFTGRYPRAVFDFVQGVIRWHNRVLGYAFLLITDRYPPFRLRPCALAARSWFGVPPNGNGHDDRRGCRSAVASWLSDKPSVAVHVILVDPGPHYVDGRKMPEEIADGRKPALAPMGVPIRTSDDSGFTIDLPRAPLVGGG